MVRYDPSKFLKRYAKELETGCAKIDDVDDGIITRIIIRHHDQLVRREGKWLWFDNMGKWHAEVTFIYKCSRCGEKNSVTVVGFFDNLEDI